MENQTNCAKNSVKNEKSVCGVGEPIRCANGT
jgi:hypothetical protein